MRSALIPLAVVLALASPVRAQAADNLADADRTEIQRVIAAQIEAFRSDDAARAFDLASPHIRTMFGDASHFMQMVQQGYQPVYRPGTFAFTDLTDEGGQLIQHVELTGPNGQGAQALYIMEREPDGSWRIDGCMLTRSEKVAT